MPIFCTNLVRGPWNKEMNFQNKGTVLVQIDFQLRFDTHKQLKNEYKPEFHYTTRFQYT